MPAYDFIARHMVDEFGVDPDRIRPEATLVELGLDSLSVVELIMDIEDEFEVELLEERERIKTLGEAAELVEERVRARES